MSVLYIRSSLYIALWTWLGGYPFLSLHILGLQQGEAQRKNYHTIKSELKSASKLPCWWIFTGLACCTSEAIDTITCKLYITGVYLLVWHVVPVKPMTQLHINHIHYWCILTGLACCTSEAIDTITYKPYTLLVYTYWFGMLYQWSHWHNYI